MEFSMKLNPKPYKMIKDGQKTVEMRLYDEKRQAISVGDIIKFQNTENTEEELRAQVVELYRFDSFKDLYDNLPLLECGYTEDSVKNASPEDMNEYYTCEEQAKYGVVGIRIRVLHK